MLAADINVTNEARESTLNAAINLMDQMQDTTGTDLTQMQNAVSGLLQKAVAPGGFGKTRMKGSAYRMKELEAMSEDFSSTNMSTLKPYGSDHTLVAGEFFFAFH